MSYALVTCHKCSSPGRRHVRSGTDDEHDVHDAIRHGVRHGVRYEHIRHICVSSSIYVHLRTLYIVSSLSVTLASRWAPSRTHGSHDNLSRITTMADPTVQPGQAQPAQGVVDTYGDRYDIFYTANASWRARRDSLLGEGIVLLNATHLFN